MNLLSQQPQSQSMPQPYNQMSMNVVHQQPQQITQIPQNIFVQPSHMGNSSQYSFNQPGMMQQPMVQQPMMHTQQPMTHTQQPHAASTLPPPQTQFQSNNQQQASLQQVNETLGPPPPIPTMPPP